MPSGGSAPINAALAYGYHYYGVFFQDDWRVTNKLTLSYGVRWDYESPVTERNNQINAGFDLNAASPVQVNNPLQPGVTQKGGLLFASSSNRRPYQRDLNNFQPRVGIAWHPANKTVVRAGYGLSYVATFNPSGTQGFSQSTPYNSSPDGGISFSGNYLNNPYPTGILTPTGSKGGLSTFLGQSVTFTNPDRVIPRVHQFSIGIQRELPGRSVLEVSYVGSRSQQLNVSQNLDAVNMANFLQYGGNVVSGVPNLADSCSATSTTCKYANPFYGLLPAGPGLATSTTRQQLLLPYPQFTGVTENNLPMGKSWYNSLQVRFDKRVTRGLNVLVSYTHAKWLNATGWLNAQEPITQTPDRTLAGQDTPNRIVISGNWTLPIFSHTNGVLGVFLKGWSLNGVFMRENGFPLGAPGGFLSTGIDPALPDGNNSKFFNTCTILTTGATTNCTFNGQTLQPAFIQQQNNTLRVLSGMFPTLRPPIVPNADLSMFKAFKLHETWNLQFRAEAFNATNSARFGGPNTSLTSTSAGVVTMNQVNDPRNIQLSLRLRF
jgi:hypothetical protein